MYETVCDHWEQNEVHVTTVINIMINTNTVHDTQPKVGRSKHRLYCIPQC